MATITIISSEVDSASTWVSPMKIVSAGTKRTPPPTPTRPQVRPPKRQIRTAMNSFIAFSRSREDQLHRDRDQERGEEVGDRALGDPLLNRGPEDDSEYGGDREQQRGADVDVAVDPALGEGAEEADEDDRCEAGAGRQALAVGEPEDQQRHDDRPAADAEEAAEDSGEGADRRQLPDLVVRGRGGVHLAILEPCPPSPRAGAASGPQGSSRSAPSLPVQRS